jgi:hypothetical protein
VGTVGSRKPHLVYAVAEAAAWLRDADLLTRAADHLRRSAADQRTLFEADIRFFEKVAGSRGDKPRPPLGSDDIPQIRFDLSLIPHLYYFVRASCLESEGRADLARENYLLALRTIERCTPEYRLCIERTREYAH